jgi:hypothetical protein
MKQITKSVIKLSEIPEHLQKDEILQGHKVHTYAEFHIDDSEQDELTLWLLSQYPTLKRKTSFLIHIDQETQSCEDKAHAAYLYGHKVGFMKAKVNDKHLQKAIEIIDEYYNTIFKQEQ